MLLSFFQSLGVFMDADRIGAMTYGNNLATKEFKASQRHIYRNILFCLWCGNPAIVRTLMENTAHEFSYQNHIIDYIGKYEYNELCGKPFTVNQFMELTYSLFDEYGATMDIYLATVDREYMLRQFNQIHFALRNNTPAGSITNEQAYYLVKPLIEKHIEPILNVAKENRMKNSEYNPSPKTSDGNC